MHSSRLPEHRLHQESSNEACSTSPEDYRDPIKTILGLCENWKDCSPGKDLSHHIYTLLWLFLLLATQKVVWFFELKPSEEIIQTTQNTSAITLLSYFPFTKALPTVHAPLSFRNLFWSCISRKATVEFKYNSFWQPIYQNCHWANTPYF